MFHTFIKKNHIHLVHALLILLVVLGFAVRIWRVDTAPKGALIDELHFGYLAHSLLETGADEHGEAWPITFRGFGDEKLPAMAYADIPSVAFFGLSILAIRVPSVLAGTLLILSVYWLSRELKIRRSLALLGACITALTPWTFFLSRFGFESNLALLFFTTGLAALLKALNSSTHKWYFSVAGALFGLSWYSYIAYRPITVAILICMYVFLFFKKKLTRHSWLALGTLALIVLPLFQPKVVGVNSTRFDQVGILSDPSITAIIIEKRNFCVENLPIIPCYLTFNKPMHLFRETTRRYLNSFSPDFLVGKGEETTDFLTIEGFAQFYPILYPFFLIGLVALAIPKIKNSKITTTHLLILSGLLLSPIPSALVGDAQKVRISAFFPFALVSILLGVQFILSVLPKKMYATTLLCLVIILSSFSLTYFTEYFGVHVIQNEYKYQSYAPTLSEYLTSLPEDTLINIRPFYSDPLMFHAFYSKIDPKVYQENAVLGELEPGGFQHTVKVGNITAYNEDIFTFGCKAKTLGKKSVFVTDGKEIIDAEPIFTIKATNGVHTYVTAYDATLFVKDLYCDQE
jgi:4-amino-4-deoxy-L-arabinose transferase-like glycosyltransferase